MSDETIRVGDLVMVVKPKACCGSASCLGAIHRVTGFYDSCVCVECERHDFDIKVALVDGKWDCRPLSVLKKINPPPVESDVERKHEQLA
jgi:hypothetical protein